MFILYVSGRGVQSTKLIPPQEFILEYRGKVLGEDPGDGDYVYQFEHLQNTFW